MAFSLQPLHYSCVSQVCVPVAGKLGANACAHLASFNYMLSQEDLAMYKVFLRF